MNNLIVRSLTGVVFVLSVVGSIWIHYFAFAAVMLIYLTIALWEYIQFFKDSSAISLPGGLFMGSGLFIYLLTMAMHFDLVNPASLIIILPLLFVYMLAELWRNKPQPIANIGIGILGLVWIVLPFSLLLFLGGMFRGTPMILIAVFLIIWTNDTFAYLSGRIFGKTKLFERISPKKTWEGTIGGVLFAVIAGWLIGTWVDPTNGLVFWIIAALLLALSAILGDLLESLMKRNLGIKDSGSIMPGHGGVLDRFDATLMAIPIFTFWLLFFAYFCAN